jgi:CHAT domain-containing protein
MYIRSLSFARAHGDRVLEANSLLNLGYAALAQGYFDEAIERSEAAYQSATNIEARVIALVAQGNIGWAAYRLGDSEKALIILQQAEKAAADLGDIFDSENLLTNIGYIYMDQRNFDLAARTFQRALILAKSIQAKQDTYNALRVLAKLAVQTGDPDKADDYAQQALTLAADNQVDKLYPTLVQGQVAAQRRDFAKAALILETVERDSASPVFLKWEAEHSLARLYQSQNQHPDADREYRAAIATFEAARATVQSEEFQLSFRTNAAHIYDDYVHFLVDSGRSVEALKWADYSRARSLLEGLGLLSNSADSGRPEPSDVGAQEISRRAKGALFFYWLGDSQSYLWVVTEQKTELFSLPPSLQIDAMVQRYRIALKGPQDVLASSNDGRTLYRTLIAPARALLVNNAKVVIIPDGSLNNLNFETLIVPDPEPHYWIEDAGVTNASSLRVLAASFARDSVHKKKSAQRLLLIGNSVAPSKEYPELPHAAEQMADVAKHFPEKRQQIYQGNLATPSSYLGTAVADFSHIHFVAHGIASRLSPLDSAIVLSKPGPDSDSFKLYARDIIRHPLRADLVTISACYGAGERAYSGEGLVGLAWAFLRAGAHNVIAALWEVTDASTAQLMDRFYAELEKGSNPEEALRAAKLSLLRGNTFRNPFYWAPFQLYAGS